MTAPTLLSSTPFNNEKDVALDSSIVLNFSEDVIKGEGYINLLYQTHSFGYTPLPWSTFSVSGYGTSQLTITPTSRFAPEYVYWLEVENGAFTDIDGTKYPANWLRLSTKQQRDQVPGGAITWESK